MRIIITASREWGDSPAKRQNFLSLLAENVRTHAGQGTNILVHGAAKGGDRLAAEWAEAQGWAVEAHPADWRTFGKAAGPRRNQSMVDLGADLCLAFPVASIKSCNPGYCYQRAGWVRDRIVRGKLYLNAPELSEVERKEYESDARTLF